MTFRVALGVAIGSALALASAGPGVARAEPDYAAAAQHYKAAEAAMAKKDYAGAALEYGVAYDITKDPILFFKIGDANDRAGKCTIALTYYRRYLKEGNPNPQYKTDTEKRIATCEAKTGGGGGGDTGAGAGTGTGTGGGDTGAGAGTGAGTGGGDTGVEPDFGEPDFGDGAGTGAGTGTGGGLGDGLGPSFTDSGTSWKRSAGFISTGVTIGLLAVGTVLYMSAEGSEEDLQALIDFRDQNGQPLRYEEIRGQYDDLVDEGKRFDKLSTIAFAAAGVSAAAAVTFFVLDSRSGGRPERTVVSRVHPRIDRDGAAVVVGWEF